MAITNKLLSVTFLIIIITTTTLISAVSVKAYPIGRGRALAGQRTCDRYPTACRAKGSAGPNCCGKQCVDTASDRVNCGKCGSKCKFSEACCGGKCVNVLSDERNCGKCNKRCNNKGSSCVYGMCSYA